MSKLLGKIHLWLSVPFGVIITLICLSGACLVFEQEIMRLIRPERYYVQTIGETKLPVDQLAGIVARSLPDSVSVTGVSISSDPRRAYQVSLSKPRRASVSIDPYTGQVLGRQERAAFFSCMFKLHRWLLDSARPGEGIFWGKLIVGVSTLMFVVVLLTGVVVWWPRSCRALKNRLKIATRKGWRRFWFDLHVSAGVYATLLLLVMSLTGLTWSFPWYRAGFYKVFGTEMPSSGHKGKDKEHKSKDRERPSGKRPEAHNAPTNWEVVYQGLVAENPDFERISISDGSASVATAHWGNQRASDSYTFDPRTGEIREVVRYTDSERASKLRGWIYSLHVGNWGGFFSKLLTVLSALIGASLPLTGYYLWIKRLRRR